MGDGRERASQFSLPSLRDDDGDACLTRRCIPVDCIPLCPTCQEHNTPFGIIKKYSKCVIAVLTIAFLASFMGTIFDTNSTYSSKSVSDGECSEVKGKEFQDDIDKKFCTINVKISNMAQEFIKLREYVYNMKGSDGSGREGKLELWQENSIIALIDEQLSKYDSDKTGLPDFALENLGGCILNVRDTKPYKKGTAQVSILGLPIMSFATDPRSIIQASVVPGECWAFEGDKGSVVIQLSTNDVLITHVSLEHISAKLSLTGEIPSAPKDFALYGLRCVSDSNPHLFGEFTYKSVGPALQTFQVQHPSTIAFGIVELVIKSNHGNKEFTCIYRVRIHGKLDKPPIKK
ncbi:hypothetical protein O3M35_001545 [Rhynocoris fuscipes]|uniref:SUN domain-containing protein n=1 Tax=Rhynocoris fuscipes TaxID=488301 RepID=A0AAW1CPC8_9HEMI